MAQNVFDNFDNMEQPSLRPVPQQRILEKMDEYMSRRDYAGAERHLLYWQAEARLGQDLRGQLLLANELIGHYRKTGQKEKALESGEEALSLLGQLAFDGTLSAGTTYVNYATALSAFGEQEKSLSLFEKALAVYEGGEAPPSLLGGLYNNLGLTLTALGRYEEALQAYDRAMAQMGKTPGGTLEQAITCLNRADTLANQLGMEAAESRIFDLVEEALALLDRPENPRDGYYAFVLEKCAPTVAYYGYFRDAERMKKEAEAIYERN